VKGSAPLSPSARHIYNPSVAARKFALRRAILGVKNCGDSVGNTPQNSGKFWVIPTVNMKNHTHIN
jgi:hypothetical protein